MKWLKQIAMGFLIISTLQGGAVVAAAQQPQEVEVYYAPLNFVFDGVEYAPKSDQQAFLYNGSTYVPLRFISNALNKAVGWNDATYTVSISDPTPGQLTEIKELNLNRQVRETKLIDANLYEFNPTAIHVYFEEVNYVFDGKVNKPTDDLPGFIHQDTLYVPMRFLGESVGKKIDWDANTFTISSITHAPVPTSDIPLSTPTIEPPIPTPAIQPQPPAGGGGGGGGGSSNKPSYSSIISEVESKITSLENRASNYFIPLYLQYSLATDETARDNLLAQGRAKLAQFDAEFNNLMGKLDSDLTRYEYSTAIIQEYRDQYEANKSVAKKTLEAK